MADDRIDPKLALALAALEAIPAALAAIAEIRQLVESTAATLRSVQAEGRDPNPEEWAALNVAVHDLRARLQA